MNLQEARPFVARFVSGNYTPEGHEAFLDWLENASLEELDMIAREYEAMHENWHIPEGPSDEWVQQLEDKLDKLDQREALVKRMRPRRRFMWGAAASVALLSAGAYLWFSNKPVPQTMASVPRGGQQKQLALADGSKVWLNAASTLQYPATFNAQERIVELSGEAYFEIADNASKPFKVKTGALQVEVLGTHFNVMAYEDEGVARTTLMEGSIRVSNGSRSVILEPGDEAEAVVGVDGINVNHKADTKRVLAWKNGYLDFNNASLQTVMRAIARSYNVEIQYEGRIPEKSYTGQFPRQAADIHEALHILDAQQIHYKFEGKTITVMP